MPAAITHYLHAKRVLEAMQKRESSFQMVGDAFYWGAQGPDFLFCSRFLPWQKGCRIGDRPDGQTFFPSADSLHKLCM